MLVSAILIAVVGAVVGSFVTWLLGSRDRTQAREALHLQQQLTGAQQRIAELETHRSLIDEVSRFSPRCSIVSGALRLEADDPFEVEPVDFLNANGVKVGTEAVGKTDKVFSIPIDHKHVISVMNMGPWVVTYDHSATIVFRIHLRKNGQRKEYEHKGHISGSAQTVSG